jgi:hypothetical protein
MSERIARPSFYEGQVLRAADLELAQDYGRGTMARHERYLHTPGIATGLTLSIDKSTGVAVVKLAPGMAVDATGRQLVVDREEQLAAEDMSSQGVLIPADTDSSIEQEDRPWHAVFLTGRDESAPGQSLSRGCGSGAQPTRTDEAYVVSYGFPGDAGEDQLTVEVTDGPEADTAVRVLVGYVQWDGTTNFGDARSVVPAQGASPRLSPRYAGVRADEVVARSGILALRADEGDTRDKRPALVLDGEQGGEMRFGLQDARGEVNTVFSVNSAGDVFLRGVIKNRNRDVWVESGTISDGMMVPLPAGVTQDKIDAGQIALHVIVTPRRVSELQPPGVAAGTFIKEPFECRVDGRRVFVRERWFDLGNVPTFNTYPGACDYVVLASASGGTP